MVVLRCKICGGDLDVREDAKIAKCKYCGAAQTLPKDFDDQKANHFNRANQYRMRGDFDRAESAYEDILKNYGPDAEAHWGALLCRYGIEYVKDPATHEYIPTCHFAQYTQILEDDDYRAAIELADPAARAVYEQEASRIDNIHRDVLRIVNREKPYDVFICYKESDRSGGRTKDSVIAHEIYDALTEKNLRVFFSRVTLEDKLGSAFEPYIFAALHSAKVMIVVGTSVENIKSVWVRNEWSRYLKIMKNEKGKSLIPVYKDMDVNDLSGVFMNVQALDAGKIGYRQDLVRGVVKLVGDGPSPAPGPVDHDIETSLVNSADTLLKMGKTKEAREVYERLAREYSHNCRGWYGIAKIMSMDFAIFREYDDTVKYLERAIEVASDADAGGFERVKASYEDGFRRYKEEEALKARIASLNAQIHSSESELASLAQDKKGASMTLTKITHFPKSCIASIILLIMGITQMGSPGTRTLVPTTVTLLAIIVGQMCIRMGIHNRAIHTKVAEFDRRTSNLQKRIAEARSEMARLSN